MSDEDEIKKLIELARKPATKKDFIDLANTDNRQHVRMFIQEMGVRTGKTKVYRAEIYEYYLMWAKQDALDINTFFLNFYYFFKKKLTKYDKVYFELRKHYVKQKRTSKNKIPGLVQAGK